MSDLNLYKIPKVDHNLDADEIISGQKLEMTFCICGMPNVVIAVEINGLYKQYVSHKCTLCGSQLTSNGSIVKIHEKSVNKCLICGRVMYENMECDHK